MRNAAPVWILRSKVYPSGWRLARWVLSKANMQAGKGYRMDRVLQMQALYP